MTNIPDDIKIYFENLGYNPEEIFSTEYEEDISESYLNSDTEISKIVSMIKSIEQTNNQQKILLGAALIEMRSQIKTNQRLITDLKKDIERLSKDTERHNKDIKSNIEKLYSKISSKLSDIIRFITNR